MRVSWCQRCLLGACGDGGRHDGLYEDFDWEKGVAKFVMKNCVTNGVKLQSKSE